MSEIKTDMREKCGVFGVYNSDSAARDIYLGLYAQQHRGQEGAGMIVNRSPGEYYLQKDLGMVTQVFDDEMLNSMPGHYGIGHVRYSTSGSCSRRDIQPLIVTHQNRVLSIAHNGNITNAAKLKQEMEESGSLFTSSSDTEVILHKIVRAKSSDPIAKIQEGLKDVEGAYSLTIQFDEGVAGVRDPLGFRPLFVGRRDDAWYFASETCAFDILGAEVVAEVEPGEGYFASSAGLKKFKLPVPAQRKFCAFELVYFSRPDSLYKDRSIHLYRMALGKALYEDHPVEADLVTAVPDSSNSAALGFATAAGIPLDIGLIRSHYTGRTFIAPHQSMRDIKVRQKFNVIRDVVEGKRVVVVDDSIVRGTTCRKIINLFREAGAKEIHFRISSPKVSHPCYFGIDMPDREEFLVNKIQHDMLRDYLHVNSIGFLSEEKFIHVLGEDTCRACFTGKYPIEVDHAGARIIKRKPKSDGKYAYI